MPDPLDLTKTHKTLYTPSAKEPAIITVPPFNFLMLDGKGDPNHNPAYQAVVEALYSSPTPSSLPSRKPADQITA